MQVTHAREKGFTLIELLVTITIIGILATIILVSLSDARARARDAQRKSQLANVVLAIQLYEDDNGSLPVGLNDGGSFSMLPAQAVENYENLGSDLTSGGYLNRMPVDPVYEGDEDNDYYYVTCVDGTMETTNPNGFELTGVLEQDAAAMENDGGTDDTRYQLGTDLDCMVVGGPA